MFSGAFCLLGVAEREGRRSETGRGGKVAGRGEEEARWSRGSGDLDAHLRGRRFGTREPRGTSKRDGASGRGLPRGRGPNPWPASRVSDPELTPPPWQPPARPIWLSVQLQGSSAAGRARAGRRDPFLQSAHGRGPFVWVSSPLLPAPGPQVGSGRKAARWELSLAPRSRAELRARLTDSLKLSAS